MARTLNASTIFSHNRYYARYSVTGGIQHAPAYIKIPLGNNVVEIPTLFLNIIKDRILHYNSFYGDFDCAVFTVKDMGCETMYKSLDSAMKDMLCTSETNHMISITSNGIKYYCGCGTVLDNDFKPLMMCSWKYEVTKDENNWKFHGIEPIIRIDPNCFIYKVTSIERYITGKFLANMLNSYGFNSNHYSLRSYISYEIVDRPKILIEKIPFEFVTIDKPSISTTNELLCDIAKSHISEMFQP